jgi:predicted metal-dependent phosphoesterase TrpH
MAKLSSSLSEQTRIIEDNMLQYLDGIECWHSRSTPKITNHYLNFAKKHGLKVTGGSDCHQKPVIMGTVNVPDYVAKQFIN